MNAPDSVAATAPILLSSASDGVVQLTLNRPQQFNALSEELLAALAAALDRIAKDQTAQASKQAIDLALRCRQQPGDSTLNAHATLVCDLRRRRRWRRCLRR